MTALSPWPRLGSVLGLTAWCLWAWTSPIAAQTAEQNLPEAPIRAYGLVGAQIFSAHCAPCHGESGAGDGPVLQDMETGMIDFRDPASLAGRSPALWQQVTAEGRTDRLMPPWQRQLTEDQMWDAVAFLWQLSTSAAELARGAAVWQSLESTVDVPPPGRAALALSLEDWQAAVPAGIDERRWRRLSAGETAAVYRYLQAQVLTPSWEPLLREGRGAVSVRLHPLSPGLELPAELPVRLQARIGHLPAGEWTDTANREEGEPTFRGLDTSPRIAYRAEVEWDGQSFRSAPVSLTTADDAAELAVEVFAVSNTQAAVVVAQLQILLALSAEGAVLIGQQALAANSLPYVFTGRSREDRLEPVTMEIPLFPGAVEVTLAEEDGTRFEAGEDKVFDSAPLFPLPQGTWSTLGYGLPWPTPGDTWVQVWPYPTSDVTVLVPQSEGLQVEIAGFEISGTREIGGLGHDVWQASTLPDGQVVVRFNEVPTVAAARERMPPVERMPLWLPWALATFLLLLLATSVVFAGRRKKTAGQDPSPF